jgi:hypothetical protein
MLVSLLNIPETDGDWQLWSRAHRTSHDKIRQAIQQQKNMNLVDYQIDPINFEATDFFLQNNSQLHRDMTAALGSQGSDLDEVDLSDPDARREWIYYHYLEHQTVEEALGV